MRAFFDGAGFRQVDKLMTGSIGDFHRLGMTQAERVKRLADNTLMHSTQKKRGID